MQNKNNSYNGNPLVVGQHYTHNYTSHEISEFAKCYNDPIYFIETYIKIITLDKGIQPFSLWDYQKKMVNNYYNNQFSISLTARQMGKSVTVAAVILHHALFNEDWKVAILANKSEQAKTILGIIKNMYERLPKWLQQGVAEWNKYSVELGNGTKIFAAATTSDSIRGQSINFLYLDEFAFVSNDVEFYTSTYPVITGGNSSKVIITSTPNGLNLFHKLYSQAERKLNEFIPLKVLWNEHPHRDAAWKQKTINNIGLAQFRVEFECMFLGSGGTLIDGEVIERMVGFQPLVISDDSTSKMFKPPVPGHRYVVTVDSAEGTGNDNSSISIFDATVRPFELVFSFANNNIKPGDFAYKIHIFSLKYNNAYILVENNSIGALVCRELWQTYENEGLLSTDNKEAVTFSSINYGVRTTKRTKKTGCRVLKLLIEGEELIIPDDDYIDEISTFAKIGKTDTYAAIRGKKDDRVMTLVLFAWYTQTEFFKEDSSINIITSESQGDDDFFELPAFYQQNTTFAK